MWLGIGIGIGIGDRVNNCAARYSPLDFSAHYLDLLSIFVLLHTTDMDCIMINKCYYVYYFEIIIGNS